MSIEFRGRWSLRTTAAVLGVALAASAQGARAQETALRLLERAVNRAGGEAALRAVRTPRYEYTTTWYRTAFSMSAVVPATSVEQNVDIRDYGREIWRYERRFVGATSPTVNVVRDSVAIIDNGRGWRPLSGAYIHERHELFLMAPELLLIRSLENARLGGVRRITDTTIANARHARLQLQVDETRVTLLLRSSDAQLTGLRYRKAQPWDFGLAAWGEMPVDVWYARWVVVGTVVLPLDVSIDRMGRPYKRLYFTRAQAQVAITEDSVAVPDSLRQRYRAEQHRAMFDVRVDSVIAGTVVSTFPLFGTPAAAAAHSAGWVMYGAGAAALLTGRAVDRLTSRGVAAAAAIVGTMSVAGAGGAPELTRRGIAVYAAASARPYLEAMYAQQSVPTTSVRWIASAGWRRIAGDSLWLEPLDLPDAEGAILVWDPSRRFVYGGDALSPAQIRAVVTRLVANRWPVETMFVRGAAMPIAEARRLAGLES